MNKMKTLQEAFCRLHVALHQIATAKPRLNFQSIEFARYDQKSAQSTQPESMSSVRVLGFTTKLRL